MNTLDAEPHTPGRVGNALVFALQAFLWILMAYWALQFVIVLWRWALGFETY